MSCHVMWCDVMSFDVLSFDVMQCGWWMYSPVLHCTVVLCISGLYYSVTHLFSPWAFQWPRSPGILYEINHDSMHENHPFLWNKAPILGDAMEPPAETSTREACWSFVDARALAGEAGEDRLATSVTQMGRLRRPKGWKIAELHYWDSYDYYGGWKKSCVGKRFIPLFFGFQPSKAVQDVFHPQYHYYHDHYSYYSYQ